MPDKIARAAVSAVAAVETMLAMLLAIAAVAVTFPRVIRSMAMLVAVTVVAAACSSGVTDQSVGTGEQANTAEEAEAGEEATSSDEADLSPTTLDQPVSASECEQQEKDMAESLDALPERIGERKETTESVPHIQIDANPVPEIDTELRRLAFSLPGVIERESRLSLPGARSLTLAEDMTAAKPEVLQIGREFGHFHPDGSMHIWLPVDRAVEVHETKWGELHPWVDQDGFWDGVVMVYTPETAEELEVAVRLIVDAYNHVTGANVDPASVC